MNYLYCQRSGHMKPILYYCINKDCNFEQSCCSACVIEIHKNHKSFDFIQSHISNIQNTVVTQRSSQNPINYKLKCKLKSNRTITSMATSSNGKMFSSGEELGKITLWRMKGKTHIKIEYQGSHVAVKCLIFSQNNKILFATTQLYNLLFHVNCNFKPFRRIQHSTRIANILLVTNDSNYLFQCSIKDRIISIWNIEHMKRISTFTTQTPNKVALSKNEKCLAICNWQNRIQLIDCQSLIHLKELGKWQSKQQINCIEFTLDNTSLLITGNFGILKYQIVDLLTNSNDKPEYIIKYSQYSKLSIDDSLLFSFDSGTVDIINFNNKEVIQSYETEISTSSILQLNLRINLIFDFKGIIVNVNNHIYIFEMSA